MINETQIRIIFGMATNLAHARTIAKEIVKNKLYTDIEFHAELALERSKFLGQYNDDVKNHIDSYKFKEELLKEEKVNNTKKEEENKLKELMN